MSDSLQSWAHGVSEAQRIAVIRLELGLELTDETQDGAIRSALADSAYWHPGASEFEQRCHAVTVLQNWLRE